MELPIKIVVQYDKSSLNTAVNDVREKVQTSFTKPQGGGGRGKGGVFDITELDAVKFEDRKARQVDKMWQEQEARRAKKATKTESDLRRDQKVLDREVKLYESHREKLNKIRPPKIPKIPELTPKDILESTAGAAARTAGQAAGLPLGANLAMSGLFRKAVAPMIAALGLSGTVGVFSGAALAAATAYVLNERNEGYLKRGVEGSKFAMDKGRRGVASGASYTSLTNEALKGYDQESSPHMWTNFYEGTIGEFYNSRGRRKREIAGEVAGALPSLGADSGTIRKIIESAISTEAVSGMSTEEQLKEITKNVNLVPSNKRNEFLSEQSKSLLLHSRAGRAEQNGDQDAPYWNKRASESSQKVNLILGESTSQVFKKQLEYSSKLSAQQSDRAVQTEHTLTLQEKSKTLAGIELQQTEATTVDLEKISKSKKAAIESTKQANIEESKALVLKARGASLDAQENFFWARKDLLLATHSKNVETAEGIASSGDMPDQIAALKRYRETHKEVTSSAIELTAAESKQATQEESIKSVAKAEKDKVDAETTYQKGIRDVEIKNQHNNAMTKSGAQLRDLSALWLGNAEEKHSADVQNINESYKNQIQNLKELNKNRVEKKITDQQVANLNKEKEKALDVADAQGRIGVAHENVRNIEITNSRNVAALGYESGIKGQSSLAKTMLVAASLREKEKSLRLQAKELAPESMERKGLLAQADITHGEYVSSLRMGNYEAGAAPLNMGARGQALRRAATQERIGKQRLDNLQESKDWDESHGVKLDRYDNQARDDVLAERASAGSSRSAGSSGGDIQSLGSAIVTAIVAGFQMAGNKGNSTTSSSRTKESIPIGGYGQ